MGGIIEDEYAFKNDNKTRTLLANKKIQFQEFTNSSLKKYRGSYRSFGPHNKITTLKILMRAISVNISRDNVVINSYSRPLADGIFWKIYVKGYFICCKKLETRVYYIHRLLGDVKHNKTSSFRSFGSSLSISYSKGKYKVAYSCQDLYKVRLEKAKNICRTRSLRVIKNLNIMWHEYIHLIEVGSISFKRDMLILEQEGEFPVWTTSWKIKNKSE